MSITLLLIDDDPTWSSAMQLMLTKKGFRVEMAPDAISGLQKAYALNPDVILLDVMLPGMDGLEVCTRLREMADIPIIVLTALDSPERMVEGLSLGADDYISKTVTPGELLARIHAVLRRTVHTQRATPGTQGIIVTYEHLTVDFEKHEVRVNGERVDLSPTEFKLLGVLVRHRGRVLPHDFLLREVWGPGHAGENRSLRLYIGYLRRKLEIDPSKPALIQSEWGVGYRFG